MKWSEWETGFLLEQSRSMTVQQLCEALGHSEVTVRMKAVKYGIKLHPERKIAEKVTNDSKLPFQPTVKKAVNHRPFK